MIDVVIGHGSALTRGTLRAALEDAGCNVREAASGTTLLSECLAHAPDVVLFTTGFCRDFPLVTRFKQHSELFAVALVLVDEPRPLGQVLHDLDRGIHDVILTPIRDADVVARVRSAARTKALQEEYLKRGRVMDDLVYGDPLTGLFNRRFMLGQLNATIAGAHRHGRELSICAIDVDRFKSINDELGHQAGDEALTEIARRIGRRVRKEDLLGRTGGEEFLLILPETGPEQAALVAEAVRAEVCRLPMLLEGISRQVTVSVGWATLAPDEEPESLLKRADRAMYEAKAQGRDRVSPGRFGRDHARR